jgi:hypothetical protein
MAVHLRQLEAELAEVHDKHDTVVANLKRLHSLEVAQVNAAWQDKLDAAAADASVRHGTLLSQLVVTQRQCRDAEAALAEERTRSAAALASWEASASARRRGWRAVGTLTAACLDCPPTDALLQLHAAVADATERVAAADRRVADAERAAAAAMSAREEAEAAGADAVVRARRLGAAVKEKDAALEKLAARLDAALASTHAPPNPPPPASAGVGSGMGVGGTGAYNGGGGGSGGGGGDVDSEALTRLWREQEAHLKGVVRDLQRELEAARARAANAEAAAASSGVDTVQWDFMRNVVLQFVGLVNRSGSGVADSSQGVQRTLCSLLRFSEAEARRAGVKGALPPHTPLPTPTPPATPASGPTSAAGAMPGGAGGRLPASQLHGAALSPPARGSAAALTIAAPEDVPGPSSPPAPGTGASDAGRERERERASEGPRDVIGKPRRVLATDMDGLGPAGEV